MPDTFILARAHTERPGFEMPPITYKGYTFEAGADLRGARLAHFNFAEILSEFKEKNPNVVATEVTLSGADLTDAFCYGTKWKDAELGGAEFAGSDQSFADFTGSTFTVPPKSFKRVRFIKTDQMPTIGKRVCNNIIAPKREIKGGDLVSIRFPEVVGTNPDGTYIIEIVPGVAPDFKGTNLNQSSIMRTSMVGKFDDCDFGGAFMKKCQLAGQFTNTSFRGAHLERVTFSQSLFQGCSFDRAFFGRTKFNICIFQGCSFEGASRDLEASDASRYDHADVLIIDTENPFGPVVSQG